MAKGLARHDIEAEFIAACLDELLALKPGNVHRFAAGHGMAVAQFERAAIAAAPHIADPKLSIGERILRATEASFGVAGVNTNLGIVLLATPLAKAAAETGTGLGLRRRLAIILAELDCDDADTTFAAIRLANPAGLGEVEKGDVRRANPRFTLIEAMDMAKDRDRIANAYVTAYSDIFDFALPGFKAARSETDNRDLAITTLHMMLLAEFRDSHIVRKYGAEVAAEVRQAARDLRSIWSPVVDANSIEKLMEFDARLKSKQLNPGTTADFVVTTIFTDRIIERMPA
jgi:triphosphoribosyl-dephospho-CoA synthase